MTGPKIVLIEDSERYITELLALLEDQLAIPNENVQVIRTEAEFYAAMPELGQAAPAVFIVDIMLPFTALGESDDHVPPEVKERALADKYYRAGLRCTDWLLQNRALREIPIIVHSILNREEIESDEKYQIPDEDNVVVCKKDADGHGIIEAVGRILKPIQV